jgi:hypothetical protein
LRRAHSSPHIAVYCRVLFLNYVPQLPVGFSTEDNWFDYRLEHDPRFLNRIAAARKSLERGKRIKLEDLSD